MHLDRWNCVVFSKGKFGETVVKSFPKLHAVAGFSEFSQTSYISECDKTSHGGRPKYIVTVSSTVSVDPNGFAFETPRAIYLHVCRVHVYELLRLLRLVLSSTDWCVV